MESKVLKLTKEQIKATSNTQRELLYKIQVAKDNYAILMSRIKDKNAFNNADVLNSLDSVGQASVSLCTFLNFQIQILNLELLDDLLLEKGFDINKDAYGKSQLIINDEKLYIEDDNGTLLPIDTLFDNIVNTIQNANN